SRPMGHGARIRARSTADRPPTYAADTPASHQPATQPKLSAKSPNCNVTSPAGDPSFEHRCGRCPDDRRHGSVVNELADLLIAEGSTMVTGDLGIADAAQEGAVEKRPSIGEEHRPYSGGLAASGASLPNLVVLTSRHRADLRPTEQRVECL